MKILKLVLTHKWYDMIESGLKREKYREITPYWGNRLIQFNDEIDGFLFFVFLEELPHFEKHYGTLEAMFKHWGCEWVDFTHVQFQRAYPKDPPRMTREIEEITIGTGNPEWGAEPGKLYFVIKLK